MQKSSEAFKTPIANHDVERSSPSMLPPIIDRSKTIEKWT